MHTQSLRHRTCGLIAVATVACALLLAAAPARAFVYDSAGYWSFTLYHSANGYPTDPTSGAYWIDSGNIPSGDNLWWDSLGQMGFNNAASSYSLCNRTGSYQQWKVDIYATGGFNSPQQVDKINLADGECQIVNLTQTGTASSVLVQPSPYVPTASSLTLSAAANKLTSSYSYSAAGPAESGSITTVQHALDANGSGVTSFAIGSSADTPYTPAYLTTDSRRYVRTCVAPANTYAVGAEVCSAWISVGPLFEMYTGADYANGYSNMAWSKASYGTCLNLSDYNLIAGLRSFKFMGYESGPVTLWTYTGTDCSGTSGTWTNSLPGGEFDVSDVGSFWAGNIQSVKFTWASSSSTFYNLVNKGSGLYMHVQYSSTSANALLEQYSATGATDERFKLLSDNNGYYWLGVASNSSMCVELVNNGTSAGTAVQQYYCNTTDAQKFSFVSPDGQYFQIVRKGTSMCIDVKNSSTAAGMQLLLEPCSASSSTQLWKFNGL